MSDGNAQQQGEASSGTNGLGDKKLTLPEGVLEDGSGAGYEYCEHMGDIGIHAWGDGLADAFAKCGEGMFGYMCPNYRSEVIAKDVQTIDVSARNLHQLLFQFMEELLFRFGSTGFFCRTIHVKVLDTGGMSHTAALAAEGKEDTHEGKSQDEKVSSDGNKFFIRAECRGEAWEDGRHSQGTEVKAITMHDLRITLDEEDGKWHTKVVVDL